jgi:hypothetical protein
MKIFTLGDSQARGYDAEISVCFGQDIALQIEAQIAKKNAQMR